MTVILPPAPWLSRAGQVIDADQKAVVLRALACVGLCEEPPGSNRSPELDAIAIGFSSPVGSQWCALLAAYIWQAAPWPRVGMFGGIPSTVDVYHAAPVGRAGWWQTWAENNRLLLPVPTLGSVALYHNGVDVHTAHHCGVVVRLSPVTLNVEGNTSSAGFDATGVLCACKPVNLSRLLGYVTLPPRAVTMPTRSLFAPPEPDATGAHD